MPKKGPRSTILAAILIPRIADGGGGGLASEAGKVLGFSSLTTPRHRPVSADLSCLRQIPAPGPRTVLVQAVISFMMDG